MTARRRIDILTEVTTSALRKGKMDVARYLLNNVYTETVTTAGGITIDIVEIKKTLADAAPPVLPPAVQPSAVQSLFEALECVQTTEEKLSPFRDLQDRLKSGAIRIVCRRDALCYEYFSGLPYMYTHEALRLYRNTLISSYYLALKDKKEFVLESSYFVTAINSGDLLLLKWLHSKGTYNCFAVAESAALHSCKAVAGTIYGSYASAEERNLGSLACCNGNLEIFSWLVENGYNVQERKGGNVLTAIQPSDYAAVICNFLCRTSDGRATANMLKATAPYRDTSIKLKLSRNFYNSCTIEDIVALVEAGISPVLLAGGCCACGRLYILKDMYSKGIIALDDLSTSLRKRALKLVKSQPHILEWIDKVVAEHTS